MSDAGEEDVRRELRGAGDGGRGRFLWFQIVPMLIVAGNSRTPPTLRVIAVALAVLVLVWIAVRRRPRFPADAPLRRAVIESAATGEVIVRLEDGALWGFKVAPEMIPRLHQGEVLMMPEPAAGAVALALENRVTGRYEAFPGKDCRLYRPAPSTYVAPVAALDGDGDGSSALSEDQARTFLEHRIRSLGRKVSPRRRRVLADIGTQPTLEVVVVAEYRRRRAEVRTGDGRCLGWPLARDAALLGQGRRVWATRVEEGLYVVLVTTTDEGRRAEVIWPSGPAAAGE